MKKLILLYATFHLLIILIINVYGTIDSYKTYSYGYIQDREKSVLNSFISEVISNQLIWNYSSYAGIESSYGFYAPNVASQFSMSFSLIDSTGKILAKAKRPYLSQGESVHRFDLCLSLMQEKLGWNGTNDILNDYLKVIIHRISIDVKRNLKSADKVITTIYLYEYPTIKDYLNGKREKYIPVERYEF